MKKIESIVWDYQENWEAVCEFLENTDVVDFGIVDPKEIYLGLKPGDPGYIGGIKETPTFVDHKLKIITKDGNEYIYQHRESITKRDGKIFNENQLEVDHIPY